ncbi:VWA domain-containing protein [Cellulomonas xiejunii]|uniref:VWA domain-containing protein n=2 Tax=Cellulomonas xiejunii TaxID=2968083 RepID=A0ABY5KQ98_9CELL|nr:VWA domain-containing protein [Cellulomonas xiejunii]UUI72676.1 VWA domain-containing protein [Cellulomonas xiejunii]
MTTAQGSGPAAVPLEVPTPTGNEAVITVRVGADRAGTTGVTGLAGVTLQLYDGTTAPTTPVAADWATCVSDADGDCSFVVPDTQAGPRGCTATSGANCDRRFWVVQTGVPEGFTANDALRTGNGDGSGSQVTAYQFRTGRYLRAGTTYTSQSDFMVGTGSTTRTASGGTWQQSRVNPAPLQQCGINVALVLDLSGSVTSSQLVDLKAAADTFVDSLVGTPSGMALFSFSTVTPAEGATQNYPGVVEVSTQAGADQFKSRYASWTAGGGTNWDRGLAAVAEATGAYDLAVVITDGDPTLYSQPSQGPGNFTRLREMENGIFSANEVKNEGTRVLAVGVGAGVGDAATARNLAAISGPTAYDGSNSSVADYYQVADYTVVGQALRQLALGDCAGSLSVVKQLVGSDGDIASATPGGAGWTFDASTASPGVSLATPSATTDASSAVSFPVTYEGGVTAGTIAVQEQPRAGTTLFPVEGVNAVCTNLDTGEPVPATNAEPSGFSVDVPSTAAVSCTVYNQEAASASVTVDKEWVVNGAAPVPEGNQLSGLTSQLTLTGPQDAAATPQSWHVTRTGYVEGESVTFAEEIILVAPDVDPDLCQVEAAELVAVDGQPQTPVDVPAAGYQATLHEGANSYTVRNTIVCESRLTLAKDVVGSADASLWTLSALPGPDTPAGQLPGPTGQAGSAPVTDQVVTADVVYQLAESNGPATYLQDDQRTSLESNPLSTGSWNCVRVAADGTTVPGFNDGLNGGVSVPLATRVSCAATNRTAQIVLEKEVVNDSGGTAVVSDFTLRAVPSATPAVAGLTDVEVTGATPENAQVNEIRPGHPYALSETGPDGYTLTEIRCTVSGTEQVLTEITVPAGETAVCVFVNDDEPATLTLRKVVEAGATGATQTPADWTLTATPQGVAGQGPVSGNGADGVTAVQVLPGGYQLSESTVAGFAAGTWACATADGTAVTVTDDVVDLVGGADVTCTITNTAQPSTLTLVKQVVNDAGGTATVADWTLTATGPTAGLSGVTGDAAVTDATVAIGSYTLSESGPAGYAAGDWACATDEAAVPVTDGAVTIGVGQNVTCTIVNTDQPALLTLRKVVEAGTTGATQTPADWTLTATPQGITGQDPVSGDGEDGVTAVAVFAGGYALSESTVAGFGAGAWVCATADGTAVGVADGVVTLDNGADVTCTIANTAQPSTLTLVKQVVNDAGGTATVADWTLTATGPTAGLSGVTGDAAVTDATVAIGSYTLSESGPAGYAAGDWACATDEAAVPVADGAVTIGVGQNVTCTIVNTDQPALLTLRKVVEAGTTGATQTPADWTLTAAPQGITGQNPVSGDGEDGVTAEAVFAGGYALSESTVAGFGAGAWVCATADGTAVGVADGVVTLDNGADVTCTITNTAQPSTLTLVKQVVNDAGGTATVADWTLTATGPTAGLSGVTGDAAVTDATVAIGSYTLSESGPAGYAAGDWACATDEAAVPVADGAVTIELGQNVTCTIVNTDQPALLTLRKVVDAGTTGATQTPADWTVRAAPEGIEGQQIVEGNGADGVTAVEVFAGTYALSESFVDGFDAGTWTCEAANGDPVTVDQGSVTLANGADVTCSITNTALPATLTLAKLVNNDDGGTAQPRDVVLTATGPAETHTGLTGDDEITTVPVTVGDYVLSEGDLPGYTAGDWTCSTEQGEVPVDENSTVSVGTGQDVACSVLNEDQPATLTLTKDVGNDHGGTAEPADWTLTAAGPTTVTGTSGSDAVTGAEVNAGAYALSEADGPADYTAGAWSCEGGSLSGSTVTVTNGEDVTCTIVNTFDAPRLTLVKVVLNEQGGTAVPEDWTLRAAGPETVSGATRGATVTDVPVEPGRYTLSELDGPEGYTSEGWECEDADGPVALDGDVVDLAAGDATTCTVTNTDRQAGARWTAFKISDPPSGEEVGPGDTITYTVVATAVGNASVEGVVVTDDLSEVLNSATLVPGSIQASTGDPDLVGDELIWRVGTLVSEQTLSYSVRVDDDVDGDVLTNVVTAPGADPCITEDSVSDAGLVTTLAEVDPAEICRTTTHPTPTLPGVTPSPTTTPTGAGASGGWALATTGATNLGLGAAALGLLTIGGALASAARRRRLG